jgi:hypothetical protein
MDPIYFVSAETGEVVDPTTGFEGSLQISIPAQLPVGVSAADVKSSAQASSRGALVLIIIQVVLQVFLKGSMEEQFNLFLVLQMSKSISIYPVNFPANSLIYLKELRSLIDFELLDPNIVLKYIYIKKEDQDFVLDKNLENSGIRSPTLVNRMGSYIFLVCIFLIVLFCAYAIKVCFKKFREQIKAKLA